MPAEETGSDANPAWFARGPHNLTGNGSASNSSSGGGGPPAWLQELPYDRALIQAAQKYLTTVIVLVIMVSMGCHIDYRDIINNFRRPVGVGLGLFCQFLWMPLMGFAYQYVFSLNDHHSLGLMIIATTPGGSISNLFTYWSHGDVPLSICMTACSTLAAFGMMPLNLYIYQRSSVHAVPYASIAITLAICVLPVLLGMAIRHKWVKISDKITKAGSKLGMLGIMVSMTLHIMANPHMFLTTWRPYVAVSLLPVSGILAGLLTSTVTCLPYRQRRTIAIETGCQNVAMAIAIVLLAFTGEQLSHVMLVPFLYGIFSLLEMFIFTLITHLLVTRAALCVDTETVQADGGTVTEKGQTSKV